MLESYGWRGTFFVVIRPIIEKHIHQSSWRKWREVARRGHEVASHSWTHQRLKDVKDPAVYHKELHDSKEMIAKKTGIAPLTFAYPGCAYDQASKTEVMKYYISARACTNVYGRGKKAGKNWHPVNAINDIKKKVSEHGWHVALIHNIGRSIGYRPTTPEDFRQILDYVKNREKELWVDTYANVALYKKAREDAKIVVLGTEKNSITFKLALNEKWNSQLPRPYLTVKIPLKNKPEIIFASLLNNNHVYNSYWENGTIYADLPPGDNPVKVTWRTNR